MPYDTARGWPGPVGSPSERGVRVAADQPSWSEEAVRRETWSLAGRDFELTWPADMDALLDLPATAERFARDEYLPYWAQPWPASVLLAEAVLTGEHGAGRSAVDLGCGIGLVSLAAAVRGWSVTAADYDGDALHFTALNAGRNHLQLSACERIDYRHPLDEPRFDRVFAADLLYERGKSEPVARWIGSALRSGGRALISDPNRSAADGFPDQAARLGFHVRVQEAEIVGPAGLTIQGRIWHLER